MRVVGLLLAGMLAWAGTANAVEYTPEFRPFVGAYIPTGDQSDVLGNALMVGGQAAVEMSESFHLVGTLAYAKPEIDRPGFGSDLRMFQYDVGGELFRVIPMRNEWTFRPFAGAGLGARTHDVENRSDLDRQTYLAGYGALGAEFQLSRIALRLEARDYLTRFKGLTGAEDAASRNDLMLGAGLAVHLW